MSMLIIILWKENGMVSELWMSSSTFSSQKADFQSFWIRLSSPAYWIGLKLSNGLRKLLLARLYQEVISMMYKKHKMLHKNKKLNPMGFVHEKRKGPLIWPKKSDSGHILAFVFKEFRPISEPSKKEADRYCYFGLFADQVVLYSLFPYCTEFWIFFFYRKTWWMQIF